MDRTADATLGQPCVAAMREPRSLIEAVQKNCHIADARHAREATMCTYLLQMRELFRWEREMPLAVQPPREDLSHWLAQRESMWNDLEDDSYVELPLGKRSYDAFDAQALNRELAANGIVYGAGYGRFRRPHFFLAELERDEMREGIRVLVSGRELARDLAAAPAALQDGTIYVRRDALRRWLWEKVEFWHTRKGEGALQRALAAWNIQAGGEAALERMLEAETETMILHELGEKHASGILGPAWEEMLGTATDRRAELLARAVRDHLADCLSTLPCLLARDAKASIHFHVSQIDGMRRELFPTLSAAYAEWSASGAEEPLREAIARGAAHWERAARELLASPARADAGAFVL